MKEGLTLRLFVRRRSTRTGLVRAGSCGRGICPLSIEKLNKNVGVSF